MLRLTELKLPLDHPPDAMRDAVLVRLGITPGDLLNLSVVRRGYDARRRSAISLVYAVDVVIRHEAEVLLRHQSDAGIRPAPDTTYRTLHRIRAAAPRPVIIGAGPCGLLAALALAEMGLRPIILERGKLVRERTRDTWGLWRRGVLVPESNVQFGEGGAGTFSDGKLYSGIKDPRHLGRKVLTEFVQAGAPGEILVASKPHIGTFRLVTVVEGIRAKIEALGGEYRFGCQVRDIVVDAGADGARRLRGLILADGEQIEATRCHPCDRPQCPRQLRHAAPARRSHRAKATLDRRADRASSGTDRSRPLGRAAGHPSLGPADYKLVHHAGGGRSVYSFCMCPGGRVVAATSETSCVVTNGMSRYSRAEFNANAGIVVGVTPGDYPAPATGDRDLDPLAGVAFQLEWERRAFRAGGGTYAAPAQRVGDLLAGKASQRFGDVEPSYLPGVQPADLADCLPAFAIEAIREALRAFDRQVPGFAMHDAVLTGVETRTSSPIRITRDTQGHSVNTRGLFPAGEGAGYAGGILSAAVDGIRIAEAVAASITDEPMRERMTRGSGVVVYG